MLSGPRGRWDRCCREAFGKTRAGFRRGAEQAPSSEPFPVPSAGSQFPNPSSPRRQKPGSVPWENNAERTAFNTIEAANKTNSGAPKPGRRCREEAARVLAHPMALLGTGWAPLPLLPFSAGFCPNRTPGKAGAEHRGGHSPWATSPGGVIVSPHPVPSGCPPPGHLPAGSGCRRDQASGTHAPGAARWGWGRPCFVPGDPPSFHPFTPQPSESFPAPARRQPKFPERASARGGIPQPCARGSLGSPTPK